MKGPFGLLVSLLFYWGTACALVWLMGWSVRWQDGRTLFLLLPLVVLAHGVLIRMVVTVKTARMKGW